MMLRGAEVVVRREAWKLLLIDRPVNECGTQSGGAVPRRSEAGPAAGDGSMTQQFETVRLETADGVATLTLSRAERLNSFTVQMHGEVQQALSLVRADGSARCLVLTGAGRGFCAGQDLGDRAVAPGSAPVDLGESIERYYKPLVLALRAMPMPTLAAVNGVAAGAGANIALACDLVFAARSASFIQSFSKIGLVPDSGGTWWLPRLVGPARAMGLALTGEKIAAEQAEAWGLIWKCVDDELLMPAVTSLAKQLAAGPTLGYVRTRQAMDAGATLGLAASLELERDLQRELGNGADYREGVAAFMEKRTPRFRGR
jgi:2-(1,2-epoxy-1,2-dihydrophenyl)acetyl-CoA isomerase